MSKFSFDRMPAMQVLRQEEILTIHRRALEILEQTGVRFEHPEMLACLEEKGCMVDRENLVLRVPAALAEQAIAAAPSAFSLYNRKGQLAFQVGVGSSHYAAGPGSPNISGSAFPRRTGTVRDYVQALNIAEAAPALDLVDASIVPADVPQKIADLYVLYQMMRRSDKVMLGEAWEENSVKGIARMMAAVAGSPEAAKEKPFVILAACPAPPMRWEKRVIDNVLDCMEAGIPVFLCPSPVMGVSAPVTIAGSVLTHTVEALAFLTFMQLIQPGYPVLYGGISSAMDMRTTYCSSSAVEACLFTAGFSCMAHYYGLPTVTFLAQTDAKGADYQAGFETGMDLMTSTLADIDIVFGGGTLDSYLCTSNEKLAMDGQFFRYGKRIQTGIQVDDETLAQAEIQEIRWGDDGTFLDEDHTVEWYREEQCMLNNICDKNSYERCRAAGTSIADRANTWIAACKDNLLTGAPADRLREVFCQLAAQRQIDGSALPEL